MNDDSKTESSNGASAAVMDRLSKFGRAILRYRVVLFIALVGILYGFVVFQTYHLSNDDAGSVPSDSQSAALTPHVDKNVVDQLTSLKDNSVNVQALFNQSRTNPFSE
jgi:hypothetical protein